MKILQQSKAVMMAVTVSSVVSALLPALSNASTAANTTITNTVTVNYEDAANQARLLKQQVLILLLTCLLQHQC